MESLQKYIRQHSRVAPIDSSEPGVSLAFFKLIVSGTGCSDTLRKLVVQHMGEHVELDLFDGAEHGFIEIGARLGSQELALMLIGLGSNLGLWDLLSPRTMFGESIDHLLERNLAESGLITLVARPKR